MGEGRNGREVTAIETEGVVGVERGVAAGVGSERRGEGRADRYRAIPYLQGSLYG